jgi:hypothetical protein
VLLDVAGGLLRLRLGGDLAHARIPDLFQLGLELCPILFHVGQLGIGCDRGQQLFPVLQKVGT